MTKYVLGIDLGDAVCVYVSSHGGWTLAGPEAKVFDSIVDTFRFAWLHKVCHKAEVMEWCVSDIVRTTGKEKG